MKNKAGKNKLPFILLPILLIVIFTLITTRASVDQSLIVYCSHDSIFSDEIFKKFTLETGIKVTPRYDTEASKSLGLTEKILREGENSDCDVYWSNEMFSMPVLQEHNLLKAYKNKNWDRIPDKFKEENGFWCGFGARMRVIIFNTEQVQKPETAKANFSESELSKMAIALPLYGTTLTHFAILQKYLGEDKLREIYKSWRQKGLQIVAGNGPSRNLVANGNCQYAWTDTDDYFGAVDNQAPVTMLPARLPDGKTIIIPNTVGILKHSDKIHAARIFVNYLTSAKIELAMARSSSRQIPVGPVDEKLPQEVAELQKYLDQGADLKQTFSERTSLLNWIKEEHQLK
ncbi:MAG: extracellular solute-binding protein [Lentisphaerales bacterium]|nr:extracellular solute-binding protein [Lentisphaerales bacterium]